MIIDKRCFDNKYKRKVLIQLIKSGVKIVSNFINNISIQRVFGKRGEYPSGLDDKVFHAKMVVTDTQIWLSTNNITANMFKLSCGVGYTFDSNNILMTEITQTLQKDMTSFFMRYYNSKYVFEMTSDDE